MADKVLLSEDKIKELSKSMNAEETSFLKYFQIIQSLYSAESSTSFANYFHEVNLFELETVNQIKNSDSLIKSIAAFINNVTFNKKRIYLGLSNEESIEKVLAMLKLLKEPKKYIYFIKKVNPPGGKGVPKLTIDFNKYKEIFELMDVLEDPNFFSDYTKKVIEEVIEVPKIYYVNLDKVASDKVVSYSTKFPNKIKQLYAFQNKNYEEIKQICELNAESLIRTPNCKIDMFPNLKNIEIITINSEPLPNPLPKEFNYNKVKNLETICVKDDSEESTKEALDLINLCPNVEEVSFSSFSGLTRDQFFEIFSKTTSRKIKKIEVTCEDLGEGDDFSPILKNLPKLSVFHVEQHASMEYYYSVLPVFNCERVEMDFPLLEQMLRNYIQEDESNYIRADFPSLFEEFYDYFKDKEDIMKRIESFSGEKNANKEIPYLKQITLRKGANPQNCIAKKINTFNVLCPLTDDIKALIQRTKPEFIKIKEGDLEKVEGNKVFYNVAKNEIVLN